MQVADPARVGLPLVVLVTVMMGVADSVALPDRVMEAERVVAVSDCVCDIDTLEGVAVIPETEREWLDPVTVPSEAVQVADTVTGSDAVSEGI